MTDLFTRIKAACPPDAHDLTTAEGRAEWDSRLRQFVDENTAPFSDLRQHLANMVKEWRRDPRILRAAIEAKGTGDE